MTIKQHQLLDDILHNHHNRVSVAVAQSLNQITFGSACYHHWIEWHNQEERFVVSEEGKRIYRLINDWIPYRQNLKAPLGQRVAQAMRRRIAIVKSSAA